MPSHYEALTWSYQVHQQSLFHSFLLRASHQSLIKYLVSAEDLFRFPTRDGMPTSFVMDPKVPYLEASIGIHNIFKILHIEYVRRLTYLDNPNINKEGIRFMMMMTF